MVGEWIDEEGNPPPAQPQEVILVESDGEGDAVTTGAPKKKKNIKKVGNVSKLKVVKKKLNFDDVAQKPVHVGEVQPEMPVRVEEVQPVENVPAIEEKPEEAVKEGSRRKARAKIRNIYDDEAGPAEEFQNSQLDPLIAAYLDKEEESHEAEKMLEDDDELPDVMDPDYVEKATRKKRKQPKEKKTAAALADERRTDSKIEELAATLREEINKSPLEPIDSGERKTKGQIFDIGQTAIVGKTANEQKDITQFLIKINKPCQVKGSKISLIAPIGVNEDMDSAKYTRVKGHGFYNILKPTDAKNPLGSDDRSSALEVLLKSAFELRKKRLLITYKYDFYFLENFIYFSRMFGDEEVRSQFNLNMRYFFQLLYNMGMREGGYGYIHQIKRILRVEEADTVNKELRRMLTVRYTEGEFDEQVRMWVSDYWNQKMLKEEVDIAMRELAEPLLMGIRTSVEKEGDSIIKKLVGGFITVSFIAQKDINIFEVLRRFNQLLVNTMVDNIERIVRKRYESKNNNPISFKDVVSIFYSSDQIGLIM